MTGGLFEAVFIGRIGCLHQMRIEGSILVPRSRFLSIAVAHIFISINGTRVNELLPCFDALYSQVLVPYLVLD